jgi:hypothetical protein
MKGDPDFLCPIVLNVADDVGSRRLDDDETRLCAKMLVWVPSQQ